MYTKKYVVPDYPYGYKRTEAIFSVEWKPKKGFRSVFQTVNPKTGLLNKPKYGTYHPAMIVKEEEGKASFICFSWYDDKEKDIGNQFMFNNFELFNDEEIKDTAKRVKMMYLASCVSRHVYCNVDFKKCQELFNPAIEILNQIIKTGENLWDKVIVDWEKAEALEEKGFNPFTIDNKDRLIKENNLTI